MNRTNMRKLLFIILISIAGILNAQDTKYHLFCAQDTAVLGDEIKFSLTITGIDKLLFDENDTRIIDKETTSGISFYVKPETVGKHEFGPYKIKINDQTLLSNKASVIVVRPEEFVKKVRIEIPEMVYINSIVRLSIVSTDGNLDLKLKTNEFFKVVSTSTSSSISFVEGKAKKEYRQIFEMKFIKRGELLISNNLFEDSMQGIIIPNKKVLITDR